MPESTHSDCAVAVAVLLGLGALGLPVAQRDTPTVSLKGPSLANLAAAMSPHEKYDRYE